MWESEQVREEVKSNVVAILASANITEGFGAGIVLQRSLPPYTIEHSMVLAASRKGALPWTVSSLHLRAISGKGSHKSH